MDLKGNLGVSSIITAGVRANSGAISPAALVGALTLDVNAYDWYNLTATGAQDINLPDATTLTLGWSVVIRNADGVDTLTVKDSAAGTVKAILAGKTYKFVCASIGAAAGTWVVISQEDQALAPTGRYTAPFNATSDWTDAAPYYTRTITASTHGRGLTPIVRAQELNGSNYDDVILDNIKVEADGDVILRVTKTPVDARFAGRVIII